MTRKSQQCMLSCGYARMGRKTLPWQMNLISLCQSRMDDWSGPVGLRTRLWTDHLGLWGFSDLGSFESSRSWSLCWSDTTFQLQIEAGCSQLQLPWDMVSVTSGCIFMAAGLWLFGCSRCSLIFGGLPETWLGYVWDIQQQIHWVARPRNFPPVI